MPPALAGTPGTFYALATALKISAPGCATEINAPYTSILWCAGQDRELPGCGDGRALDRCARVVDRRAAVSAEAVARRRAARGGADPGTHRVPGEVASSTHVDSTGACGAVAHHRRAGGRRIRRRHRLPARAASVAHAVCGRDLATSHGVSRYAGGAHPCESVDRTSTVASRSRLSYRRDRRVRVGRATAASRVAPSHVAQWHESPLGGPVRGRPRHAGTRLARPPTGRRS